jgi:hypothetical protein
MDSSSQAAYAQGRVQARHGMRVPQAAWREIESSLEFEHLLELVRGTALRGWVRGVSTGIDAHELESVLREGWRAYCEEVAAWHPERWRPALAWLQWLPWLPALAHLARGEPALPWMKHDATLSALAAAEPPAREAALADTPLAALAPAWNAESALAAAWRARWRALWPDTDARAMHALDDLDRLLAGGSWTLAPAQAQGLDEMREAIDRRVIRSFRRNGGTPVAGLAHLVLAALDLQRLRASLARVRVFGTRGHA